MENSVSLDLMEFIEKNILPRYSEFDKAHNMEHVTRVVRRSLEIARKLGANLNMAYTVAAYHDLGLSGPRAVHHLTSGKILIADARLKRWFSQDQMKIMKEAVEDHRASASHAPRSIYGKIMDKEQQWKRFCEHMEQKYSQNGYIKLWIPGSPNEQSLKAIRETIEDKKRLREVFDRIYEEEKPIK